MKIFLSAIISLSIFSSYAQEYDVKNINDSLLVKANAVVRSENLKIRMKSINTIVIQHKWAITILNEDGAKYAEFAEGYNRYESSPDISGSIYNSSGKEIKTMKRKDMIDHAAFDGITLASDDRVLRFNFNYNQYPYTVEFDEEQQMNQSFSLPHWFPVEGANVAVQQSTFIVETPLDYKLRYKELNLNAKAVITADKNKSYQWDIKNICAFENEVFRPSFLNCVPSVSIAPSDFQVGQYTGAMNNWLEYENFINALNKDRDILPENVKQEVHKLTDAITDPVQKIKTLYEYLQNTTHYILIKFGIGGWQPLDANYVGTKKYGDCKALSNYMVALLKEAGIKSNYVLISSGTNHDDLWEDFPSNRFDHVIACVPLPKDTMWLECTSQTVSPGFMGSFTGNRNALLIDKDGGHVVHTPVYKASDNISVRKILATIDENGNLKADINTNYTGLQEEEAHGLLHEISKEEKDKYLNRTIAIPTYTVEKSEYNETRNVIPSINEYLKLSAPDYASVSGRRLFVEPNLINKSTLKLPEYKKRVFPICIKTPYIDIDSVSITIPAGYNVESMPADVHITSKFGTYNLSYKFSDANITLIRYFSPVSATFPPNDYNDFSEFYNKIYRIDRNKMIFVKKEG